MSNKLVALTVGAVLTLVGLAGFAIGTGDLIIFGINPLHNVVHLLTGLLGVGAAYYAGAQYAKEYNQWLGIVYILVAAAGFIVPGLMLSLLNVNMADNLLHLGLGVVLTGVGFGVDK